MAREKPYFREVVEQIVEDTGKRMLTATDVQRYLHIRYEKALTYMNRKKQITVFEFAQQLL